MFIPSEITLRVLSVFDFLITNGIANNQREFCKRIRMPYFSFAQVRSKKRDIPDSYLKNICDIYNVSLTYLLKEKKPIFKGNRLPVHSIKDIPDISNASSVKRIFARSVKISEEISGSRLITYEDFEGKKRIIEFVNA